MPESPADAFKRAQERARASQEAARGVSRDLAEKRAQELLQGAGEGEQK